MIIENGQPTFVHVVIFDDPFRRHDRVIYTRYRELDGDVDRNFSYSRFRNGQEMRFVCCEDPVDNQKVAEEPVYVEDLDQVCILIHQQVERAENAVVN